jgi:NAD(P)-dependent dehydrogenase (short-subunit alcohol dehydrogenase family)
VLVPGGLERLTNKVCVVTGAASALARPVVHRLTSEGATVVGVDRCEHSVGAHARQADLTDEDQVRELFASVKTDLGRIDVLYNNTGLNHRDDHSVLDMPLAVWERVLAANLTTTTFLCCKHAMTAASRQRSRFRPQRAPRSHVRWSMACESAHRWKDDLREAEQVRSRSGLSGAEHVDQQI